MNYSKTALLLAAAIGVSACQQDATKTETTTPEPAAQPAAADASLTETQKQSRAIGVSVGSMVSNALKQYESAGVELDKEQIQYAFEQVLAGNELMNHEEVTNLLKALDSAAKAKMQEQQAAKGVENIAKGEAYLAQNAQKEGVIVTDSGLQYEVLQAAEGESPNAVDQVTVHYKGTLLDGSEFDSSYKRGEPTTFPLNRVINGWKEGLQLMTVGSKYRFVIPGELAYGEAGNRGIGPNETLIFEVELLDIQRAETPAE